MATDVFMPKFGMTMQEGEIIKWVKKEGEMVNKGDVIVEIMSDKITNNLEAQVSGTLETIIIKEGETTAIGSVIAKIKEN